jgi:hypothetical protein
MTQRDPPATTAYSADGTVNTTIDNDVPSPTLPTEDVTTTHRYDG